MSDLNNIKLGPAKVTFDGIELGFTIGGVEVQVQTSTHQTVVDQFGDTVVNEYIMGRNVTVKVPLAESTLENFKRLMPGSDLVQDGGVYAAGSVTLGTNPTNLQNIVINGVTVTFKTSAPVAINNEVLIGATAAASVANLVAFLNASADGSISEAVYEVDGTTPTKANVTYYTPGVVGNAFTLAVGTVTAAVVSGATLAGGTDSTKARVDVRVPAGYSLFTDAKVLILHPSHLPDSDKTQDFTVWIANCPGELQYAYKMDQERVFVANFRGYPDKSKDFRIFSYGDPTAVGT